MYCCCVECELGGNKIGVVESCYFECGCWGLLNEWEDCMLILGCDLFNLWLVDIWVVMI